MKGSTYSGTNDSVQLSFSAVTHYNLSIDTVASISPPLYQDEVLLSMAVAAHVKISNGGNATTADMVLPAGIWPLLISPGYTISLIKLTGSDSGQASVIIPKK